MSKSLNHGSGFYPALSESSRRLVAGPADSVDIAYVLRWLERNGDFRGVEPVKSLGTSHPSAVKTNSRGDRWNLVRNSFGLSIHFMSHPARTPDGAREQRVSMGTALAIESRANLFLRYLPLFTDAELKLRGSETLLEDHSNRNALLRIAKTEYEDRIKALREDIDAELPGYTAVFEPDQGTTA